MRLGTSSLPDLSSSSFYNLFNLLILYINSCLVLIKLYNILRISCVYSAQFICFKERKENNITLSIPL